VQLEKTRDILRLFERAASEHGAWLMQVHAALLFPNAAPVPPCGPDAPLPMLAACACGYADELTPLLELRAIMHGRAAVLLDGRRRHGEVSADAYHAFMAAVDAYSREARRVEAHFRRLLVETDPLTGVHNRQGMMRDLRREWTRALRTGQTLCVALADIDFFKRINDTWGHCVGDRVLCATAQFFKARLRPYDTIYRYGGEEFLFCLPNTDADTAAHVLDRLRAGLARQPVTAGGAQVPVTVSIGVAQVVPGHSVQDAIVAADRALYAAKDGGRNRVEMVGVAGEAVMPEMVMAGLRATREVARV
jgi:diguanylate cyclase (GGDEF)-like protein